MQFYTPTNTAQMLVAESMRNPCGNHALIAVGLDGARLPGRNAYRFPDGSAVTFTASGLPVEYVGA